MDKNMFSKIMYVVWLVTLALTLLIGYGTVFVFALEGKSAFALISFLASTVYSQSYYMIGKMFFQ